MPQFSIHGGPGCVIRAGFIIRATYTSPHLPSPAPRSLVKTSTFSLSPFFITEGQRGVRCPLPPPSPLSRPLTSSHPPHGRYRCDGVRCHSPLTRTLLFTLFILPLSYHIFSPRLCYLSVLGTVEDGLPPSPLSCLFTRWTPANVRSG